MARPTIDSSSTDRDPGRRRDDSGPTHRDVDLDLDLGFDLDGEVVEKAGRAGLTARGVLYLVSAALTIHIAFLGSPGEGPGRTGALAAVAEQPFGRALLALLAVGLGGYAFWRLATAVTYEGDPGEHQLKVWAKRIGYVGRAAVYGAAVLTSLSLILGRSNGGSAGGDRPGPPLFSLPLGRWIVLAVGAGFLIAAAYNLHRAVTEDLSDDWSSELQGRGLRLARAVATAGLIGHMAVFALVGFFVVKSAVEYDPSEPQSLDQAVRELVDAPAGPFLLLAVAAGMAAYAGFSFIEARYRRVGDG